MNGNYILAGLILYLSFVAYFIFKSGSRGVFADVVFALCLPYYLWRHITKGF